MCQNGPKQTPFKTFLTDRIHAGGRSDNNINSSGKAGLSFGI